MLLLLIAALSGPRRRPEEIEEVTVRQAAAKQISTDAAAVAVLSDVDGIFTLNGEQKAALKASLN